MAFKGCIAALVLAAGATAQNLTYSASPSVTVNASKTVPNPTLFASSFVLNVENLWDLLVGPISSAYYTTTISATPVPSSSLVPPPPLYYAPFPTGAQVPLVTKNESWSFPKDFWWGVAGAAFQVEGAVKAEGRGITTITCVEHRYPHTDRYRPFDLGQVIQSAKLYRQQLHSRHLE